MDSKYVKISKFLSLVLRHQPGRIGLDLDEQGWADIHILIQRSRLNGLRLTREQIQYVVDHNHKKRFTISQDGSQIRANQGHSIDVDLSLETTSPPDTLYHGSATRFLTSIQAQGLIPKGRHHVHLSADSQTASEVGRRHGKPVVLRVDSGRMSRDGHLFFISANGVWLTAHVPPRYLKW